MRPYDTVQPLQSEAMVHSDSSTIMVPEQVKLPSPAKLIVTPEKLYSTPKATRSLAERVAVRVESLRLTDAVRLPATVSPSRVHSSELRLRVKEACRGGPSSQLASETVMDTEPPVGAGKARGDLSYGSGKLRAIAHGGKESRQVLKIIHQLLNEFIDVCLIWRDAAVFAAAAADTD